MPFGFVLVFLCQLLWATAPRLSLAQENVLDEGLMPGTVQELIDPFKNSLRNSCLCPGCCRNYAEHSARLCDGRKEPGSPSFAIVRSLSNCEPSTSIATLTKRTRMTPAMKRGLWAARLPISPAGIRSSCPLEQKSSRRRSSTAHVNGLPLSSWTGDTTHKACAAA